MKGRNILIVLACACTVAIVACGASVNCTINIPAKQQFAPMLGLDGTGLGDSDFNLLVGQAEANADAQGYQNLTVVIAGISVSELVNALQSGGSSASAFQRVTLTNAQLVNSAGTAVATMTNSKGQNVGSANFKYHLANSHLVLDNPSIVDQWVLSYDGIAQRLAIGIPDLTVDSGTTSHQVTVATGANFNSTEISSDSKSWYSQKDPNGPGGCLRCAQQ